MNLLSGVGSYLPFSISSIPKTIQDASDNLSSRITTVSISKSVKTITELVQTVFNKSHFDKLIELVKRKAYDIFNQLAYYKAYIVGPTVSAITAVVVRLSFGKRVPASGPLYITIFVALAALITVWAVQFFKHPESQKIIQNQGVTGVLAKAMAISSPKVIESLHSRHFKSQDQLDILLQKPSLGITQSITQEQAGKTLTNFKHFCEWGRKKITLTTATSDTLAVLKTSLISRFQTALTHLVIFGNKPLLENFIEFADKDTFITSILKSSEKDPIYDQFGVRLSYLLNKQHLIGCFKEAKSLNTTILCIDAVMCANLERIIALTNSDTIDALIVYPEPNDLLLHACNFKMRPINVVQGAVLMGHLSILQRIGASLPKSINWHQIEVLGLNLLELAALSGSKQMWDFIRQTDQSLPKQDTEPYLRLIYAAIKGGNEEVISELLTFIFDDPYKQVAGALIVDLYAKALVFNSTACIELLKTHEAFNEEMAKKESIKTIVIAAARAKDSAIFEEKLAQLDVLPQEKNSFIKELYEQACKGEKPSNDIIKTIQRYESSCGASLGRPLDFQLSSEELAVCAYHLDDQVFGFILSRISLQQMKQHLAENSLLLERLIEKSAVLPIVLEKCRDEKLLKVVLAKKAIEMQQVNALRTLCETDFDAIKKLPDSDESLLSYALLSVNPELIEVILAKCGSLSSNEIQDLKKSLSDLISENDGVYKQISRLLDAKGLQRASPSTPSQASLVDRMDTSMTIRSRRS